MLTLKLTDKSIEEIQETLLKRYKNQLNRILQNSNDDVFEFYMNGKKVTRVKKEGGKQMMNEGAETTTKEIVNEQVDKMKKLMGYDPTQHLSTINVKKNRNF